MREWQYKYACLYLKKHGYEIRCNKEYLFQWTGKPSSEDYTTKRVQTKVIKGKDFYQEKIKNRLISYQELKDYGYIITSRMIGKEISKRYGKRVATTSYDIRRPSGSVVEVQKIPDNVMIEINPEENWIRLKGPPIFNGSGFGFGEKTYYQKKPIVRDRNYPDHALEWSRLHQHPDWLTTTFEKMRRHTLFDEKIETLKEQVIPEIPLIFSDNKELICIPSESSDVNRVGEYGMPGGGKSVSMASIMSRVAEKTNDMMMNINDPLDQYHNCSMPVQTSEFKKLINYIGEEPKCLPIVNFWFASKDVEQSQLDNSSDFILPFPMEILLEKWNEMFKGSSFELDKSAKYLSSFKEGLMSCRSVEDVITVIEAEMSEVKGWDAMKFKWRGLFHTLFEGKMLDVSWGEPLEWELYHNGELISKNHPIFICMEAGLVPNIITSKAKHYGWFKPMFAEWFNIIRRYQEKKPAEQRSRIWVFADELGDIHMQGKQRDALSEAFLDLFRQGRPLDIYPVYNIQLIGNLDPSVKKMTGVGILTRLAHVDEKKEIKKMFDIDEKELEGIDHMPPLHFIVVSKTPFTVYDRYGQKQPASKSRRVYRGRFVPPLCHTHIPHKRVKVDIAVDDRGVHA